MNIIYLLQSSMTSITSLAKKINNNPYSFAVSVTIDTLVQTLKDLSHHYYNTKHALVTDEIYDILTSILKNRDPTHPFFDQIGAPIDHDVVKLPYFMPSLDKVKSDTDAITKWIKIYQGPYVLSDKLDGVSGLFVKTKGLYKLYTRGNGIEGQDITHLIPFVIPNIDTLNIPNNAAIRGELIISKHDFETIKDSFAIPRGAVAGVVNAKNFSVRIAKLTRFISYAIIHPPLTQTQQMTTLKKWKCPLVTYRIDKKINNNMLSNYLIKRRNEGNYDIDGIVVVDSNKYYSLTQKKPHHAKAFKMVLNDQIAETIILDVEWTPSMYGYLKPRIVIDPVVINGTTIKYATAHNALYVVDNLLGPGAVIQLIRSGDVIPKIHKVLKPAATGKPKLPDIPYKWNKTRVDLIVKDIHGAAKDSINTKTITHFFKVMKVKFISEGIVTKLVDAGYNTVIKVISAKLDDLINIDGVGTTLVKKIFTNIKHSFKVATLPQLMAASSTFGRGFGVRRLNLIIENYPKIMTLSWTTTQLKNKVINIDGFDDITATQFSDNFNNFKKFFDQLSKVANIKHLKYPKKIILGKLFTGMRIVFTGFRDKDLQRFVESNGGKVTTSVSKNTSLVVYVSPEGKAPSAKLVKAKQLGITLLTRNDFNNKYKK